MDSFNEGSARAAGTGGSLQVTVIGAAEDLESVCSLDGASMTWSAKLVPEGRAVVIVELGLAVAITSELGSSLQVFDCWNGSYGSSYRREVEGITIHVC